MIVFIKKLIMCELKYDDDEKREEEERKNWEK